MQDYKIAVYLILFQADTVLFTLKMIMIIWTTHCLTKRSLPSPCPFLSPSSDSGSLTSSLFLPLG